MPNYEKMTDEQLIRKLREGNQDIIDFLMNKYKNLVRKEANAMFLLGGDTDDLIQEGMIGLFKALQKYEVSEEASFYSFAKLCIRRQIYTAIEAAKRKKHGPLNSYVSLYEKTEGENQLVDVMMVDESSNPESMVLSQENANRLEEMLEAQLSQLEKRVLYLHMQGTDYKTIALLIDKSPKTVDNALQRIKAKTQKILEQEKS